MVKKTSKPNKAAFTKKYYGVFTKSQNTVEVEFPDIEGCYAFGFDLADAYNMAFDELFNHLPNTESGIVNNPSSYEDIKEKYSSDNQVILPFLVDLNRLPSLKS